jgi:hypothetical protein
VNVGHIDNESAPRVQRGCRGLRKKQRCLEVGADEVVPVAAADVAERRGVEGGGVVDQDIEAAEGAHRRGYQAGQLPDVE